MIDPPYNLLDSPFKSGYGVGTVPYPLPRKEFYATLIRQFRVFF